MLDDIIPGLKTDGEAAPRLGAAQALERPIDRLKPGSELHQRLRDYLLKQIDLSEREMKNFYSRWRINEMKVQAYIDLEDWERRLKELNQDKGKAPKVVSVIIPYSFATISTIVTYLMHTFSGRKPMFQVGSYKKETVKNAQMMEMVLQYNADHTRLIRHLHQFCMDAETYGVGILRTRWRTEKKKRTVWKKQQRWGWMDVLLGEKLVKVKEERTTYQGNEVVAQDPFMFFPDPRVPMCEVNRRGEFVWWRTFEGKHVLLREAQKGSIKWLSDVPQMQPNANEQESARSILTGGSAHPGLRSLSAEMQSKNYYQIDQGTVWIIPKEHGLSDSEKPEMWLFTIANKHQIIQAEPADLDHGMHPVVVTEPNSLGYGFGQPGIADFLGPMQDTLSWLVNSHIANVRTVLNNMIVVDPSMVEVQDLKNPDPGKIIRLKKSAWGQDVRAAINQLSVMDVTSNHIRDFELFMRMGDALSSVNDNLRGLQDQGGRKTATEVRTSGEAAASRLAAHARLISAQALVDLAEQMCVNIQQFLEEDFYISLTGLEGMINPLHAPKVNPNEPVHIAPEMLAGDFYYPIHDGTLPLDRVAMIDVWKEIFMAVAGDQQLRGTFNLVGIFEFIADLAGAKNLDQFKVQLNTLPPGQDAPQGGNIVPLPKPTPGVAPNPGDRMAGAL